MIAKLLCVKIGWITLVLDLKFCTGIGLIGPKYRNFVSAQSRKVLPFSVKNELGLENYLGYQCTKFCENR